MAQKSLLHCQDWILCAPRNKQHAKKNLGGLRASATSFVGTTPQSECFVRRSQLLRASKTRKTLKHRLISHSSGVVPTNEMALVLVRPLKFFLACCLFLGATTKSKQDAEKAQTPSHLPQFMLVLLFHVHPPVLGDFMMPPYERTSAGATRRAPRASALPAPRPAS